MLDICVADSFRDLEEKERRKKTSLGDETEHETPKFASLCFSYLYQELPLIEWIYIYSAELVKPEHEGSKAKDAILERERKATLNT